VPCGLQSRDPSRGGPHRSGLLPVGPRRSDPPRPARLARNSEHCDPLHGFRMVERHPMRTRPLRSCLTTAKRANPSGRMTATLTGGLARVLRLPGEMDASARGLNVVRRAAWKEGLRRPRPPLPFGSGQPRIQGCWREPRRVPPQMENRGTRSAPIIGSMGEELMTPLSVIGGARLSLPLQLA